MQSALLLDRNYMALSIVTWKKAVKLIVKGKAEAVDSESFISSISYSSGIFNIPAVIRLVNIIPWRAHMKSMRFNRRNMLIRDNNECQYCGIKVGKNAATIDHVVPTSKGGPTDYLNCVTSCKKCNNVKRDRTPAQASMALLNKPKKPTFHMLYRHYLNNPPQEWKTFIIGM